MSEGVYELLVQLLLFVVGFIFITVSITIQYNTIQILFIVGNLTKKKKKKNCIEVSLCLTSLQQLRSYADGAMAHLIDWKSRRLNSGHLDTRRVVYQ